MNAPRRPAIPHAGLLSLLPLLCSGAVSQLVLALMTPSVSTSRVCKSSFGGEGSIVTDVSAVTAFTRQRQAGTGVWQSPQWAQTPVPAPQAFTEGPAHVCSKSCGRLPPELASPSARALPLLSRADHVPARRLGFIKVGSLSEERPPVCPKMRGT